MSRLNGVVDPNHIVSVAQRRCQDHGVTVHFDPWAETAMTNGRDITIPAIRYPVTQDALDKLYGFLIHECGHHTRPKVFEILNNARPPGYLAGLYNIIEDEGMERATSAKWKGDHIALSNANDIILNECKVAWLKDFEEKDNWDEVDNGPLVSMLLAQVARLKWDTASEIVTAEIIKHLPDAPRKLFDELLSEDWHRRIEATTDEQSTWQCAVDLAKRLYPDRGDTIRECETAAANGEPRDTGDEQHETENDASGGTERSDLEEGYNITWKDATLSEHDDKWSPQEEQTRGGIGITWEDYTGGNVVMMPESEVRLVNLKDKAEEKHASWGSMCGTKSSFMCKDKESRALGNQIRRYIQSKARTQVSRHKYNGRLDKASLVKVALPPIDGGDYNRKLFYSFDKRQVKDTAISVLVDWSGSMHGKKMILAADAAGRLAQVLSKQIGVPVEVLAFTTRYTLCDIGLIKEFHERSVGTEEIARRFSAFYKYSSGNNDADAVAIAYRRLLKRKESRKILIVLSDGAPTDSWAGGHADANLKYVNGIIDNDKRVELWGIGIMDNNVQRYYKHHVVLDTPECINTQLFAIVKHGYEDYRRQR